MQEEYSTDEACQDFAKWALKGLAFLYSNTESDDPKVSLGLLDTTSQSSFRFQEYKGLFRSPFIVQTFAAHFTAIQGAVKVPLIGDPHSPDTLPTCGLALSAAAVSHMPAYIVR